MSFDFDLFVIGGGSGGVRAARVAAQTGARVALAEQDRYGGTCVIRGCVPKKLMVFASEFSSQFADARAYGWDVSSAGFEWPVFKTRLHAELDRLELIYRGILKNNDVQTFDARATVLDAHTVRLADDSQISAKYILLAMGGRPTLPEIPGVELAITSDDVFHLERLPKRILIVGGGYIACEFACILNGIGVQVTQFYRGTQILRGFDDEARALVAAQMRDNGIDLRFSINALALRREDADICVDASDGGVYRFDEVLMATGRSPNTQAMGLEALGLNLGANGKVQVDAFSQTALPSIYAVGDVTDRMNLTPVAIREGMAFVETVFKANPTQPDYENVPTAIFTQPEMGTVGLSEEEAGRQGPITIFTTSFRPMRSAFAERSARALMKLVVATDTQRVLGCQIVAPGAGEMIQLVGIAVKMGATKADFDRTVAVHPTMTEELVTMSTAVRMAGK